MYETREFLDYLHSVNGQSCELSFAGKQVHGCRLLSANLTELVVTAPPSSAEDIALAFASQSLRPSTAELVFHNAALLVGAALVDVSREPLGPLLATKLKFLIAASATIVDTISKTA